MTEKKGPQPPDAGESIEDLLSECFESVDLSGEDGELPAGQASQSPIPPPPEPAATEAPRRSPKAADIRAPARPGAARMQQPDELFLKPVLRIHLVTIVLGMAAALSFGALVYFRLDPVEPSIRPEQAMLNLHSDIEAAPQSGSARKVAEAIMVYVFKSAGLAEETRGSAADPLARLTATLAETAEDETLAAQFFLQEIEPNLELDAEVSDSVGLEPLPQ